MAGDAILVDFLSGKRAARCLCRYRPHRRNNFGAPAIGERDRQSNSGIVARYALGVFDQTDDVRRELSKLPDDLQTDGIAMQLGYLAA